MRYISVRAQIARIFLLFLLALAPIRALSVGWTPTDGGLVLNLKQGDRFLLSVWVDKDEDGVEDDGEEFFVINYNRYTGGWFGYEAGSYLKLAPQAAGATEPSDMSIWSVGAPLVRTYDKKDASLGGIVYTIWNDGKTLRTGNNNESNWQFYGYLTDDYSYKNACDAAFVIPTDRTGIISFDPNKTMNRADQKTDADKSINGRFNGKTGTGFLGMTYREVYWLEIPRENLPVSYTNAALVTFNTTLSNKSWSAGTINKGKAAFAFADSKYDPTTRTIFRIYMLDDPINSCGSYYFATDVQNKNKKYRSGPGGKDNLKWTDSTTVRKIYTWDHLYCMDSIGGAPIYKSGYMNVPAGATSKDDSTFYYVGKNDTYVNEFNKRAGYLDPSGTAVSQFKYIDSLRIFALKDSLQPNGKPFIAPAGAYGRMVVDTTSTKQNLDVAFEPKGYFFQTNSGKNVNMRQVDDSTWMIDAMWYIDPAYMTLQARIMLYTGAEFNSFDPGAAIKGWSVYENATDIPVVGGTGTETASGKYGWARIHTNRAAQNGGMEFVVADQTRLVHYDNNGHFGVAVPDQYPEAGKTKVAAQAPRLIEGYEFDGWNTKADGSGTTYDVGDSIPLPSPDTLTLYAQARYTGSIHVAISFMKDGQRYFLTHPSSDAPRFARIRHFEDWENVWQGMADNNNNDPNYISTYKIIGEETTCTKCEPGEYVLDPHSETMKGAVDSLVFYENFHPADEEYIGLYYESPYYYILANDKWEGLFTSSAGWPTPANACVTSTRLASDSYLQRNGEGVLTRYKRTVTPKDPDPSAALLPAHIRYDSVNNVFDGVTTVDGSTEFMISGVGVVDEHYIIQPDTSAGAKWRDTIEFCFHEGVKTREDVWSKLIGKQLLAQMKVGDDTIYFHPNRDKIINDPNELYLSQDFRVTQLFNFIRDSRVPSLPSEDQVSMQTTSNYWHYNIISGMSSPFNIKDAGGNYIDIVDTFRIELSQGDVSKIKKYYGHWADDAPGMYFSGTSRVRDIIVRTKTYHYGDTLRYYKLEPENESYTFGPLVGQTRDINFILTKITSRKLYDAQGNELREDIIGTPDTITTQLNMLRAGTRLKVGQFDSIPTPATAVQDQHVTLYIKEENVSGVNYDTLIISKIRIAGVAEEYAVDVRVPILQIPLEGDQLIWSVEHEKQRYYIMAADGALTYRQYKRVDTLLYKAGTNTELVLDYGTAAETQKLTPWKFAYVDKAQHPEQLKLKTEYTLNKYFGTDGTTVSLNDAATVWSYYFANVYTNANANYEEQVRLKYGPDKWLKFTGSGFELQADSATATVFSWSYPNLEYYLTDNGGNYPTATELTFGRDDSTKQTVSTCYKALKRYSMLVGNQATYFGRVTETNMSILIDPEKEWKTSYTLEWLPDSRKFDGETAVTSGLTHTYKTTNLISTIQPATGRGKSPFDVTIGGKHVNIVDTVHMKITLQTGAPYYRFFGKLAWMKSLDDTELKIPVIRQTYHTEWYDSLACRVANHEIYYSFPNTVAAAEPHEFDLSTIRYTGGRVLDVTGFASTTVDPVVTDVTSGMDFSDARLAEVRLADQFGNKPDWCEITGMTAHTVTVRCTKDGIRSPRSTYLYFAFIVRYDEDRNPATTTDTVARFVNYRITIAQPSKFDYANNQVLTHSRGASGDTLKAGVQQVHENKRILYYYPDQDVELPVRERHFFGWWRWHREGNDVNGEDVSDTDIPDSLWRKNPTNTGKYPYPFRTIGDSVDDGKGGKKLVTMGRYTVFHYRSGDDGGARINPPINYPSVAPPTTCFGGAKPTLTYAVDISNYYDNLPMSLRQKNQVDTALLDTIDEIIEPTLSLREVFELRPWTEMAERLEGYKDTIALAHRNQKYMEDHKVLAPIGTPLLLSTEQRYINENVAKGKHSESLLGYYMRDDNWATGGWDAIRKDTMIWCGGWDADCKWYTYDPKAAAGSEYTECTYQITQSDDYLNVPAKPNISDGHEFDTVYYCLRARSKYTTRPGSTDVTVDGLYWFNICRYMIIYHNPKKYGPLLETKQKGVDKAIITNDEIEQRYEVLETLDFDYNQPGSEYTVYPHPLPWADVSYGFTYPQTSDLPHNRYHTQYDFPNFGEYGLINRIPEATHWEKQVSYWHPMEQHGGADKGYMIYCDGMSSSGQVAALSLKTFLCAGQKMFFSAYVANPYLSEDTKYARPNFTISVQGSTDNITWSDITTYMTGDLEPSNQWYQIFFPIIHVKENEDMYFRVKIFNMASNWDGNDFLFDDMRIIATKPPLVAYQASTACKESEEDTKTHVILRLDYQGISGNDFNSDTKGDTVIYTVQQMTPDSVYSFVPMDSAYLMPDTAKKAGEAKADTLYGHIYIPAKTYEPVDEDSIYDNMNELIARYDATLAAGTPVQEGYIYEILEGTIRSVKYIIHSADMPVENQYKVRIASSNKPKDLMSSICGMTSDLRVTNRMVLAIDGEEQPTMKVDSMCANATYDLGLHVKGSMYVDSVAPVEITGTCYNDWLLYGDTAKESSKKRYGYYYSDIVAVVKDILRREPAGGVNRNQFASSFAAVKRKEMDRMKSDAGLSLITSDSPYDVLKHLVDSGFLTLYKPTMTVTVQANDSVKYVIFPIIGSGSDDLKKANVEVCTMPLLVKLAPKADSKVPLILGGIYRDSTERNLPITLLMEEGYANGDEIKLKIDSIITDGMTGVAIDSIYLYSTNDSLFRPGIHTLQFQPDKAYNYASGGDNTKYYDHTKPGQDTIRLHPASSKNYQMREGYRYTFVITLKSRKDASSSVGGCPLGRVPFTIGVVPAYMRWSPQSSDNNQWNNPDNWIGITQSNTPIHEEARFAPLSSTYVVIPQLENDLPYPSLPNLAAPTTYDSIREIGFEYNKCNYIRFLAGSAISQQHRMQYEKVIVDMNMPHEKWAFRSTPIAGLISGDLYMSQADINRETSPWEVGAFDMRGRSYTTGTASFWLSLYNQTTRYQGNDGIASDTVNASKDEWSRVTNALTEPLRPGQGWAVYTRTANESDANVRLPKNDDIYYYYTKDGKRVDDLYESNLRFRRDTLAGGEGDDGKAGKLLFHPTKTTPQTYTLYNGAADTTFVFGNPTMGYIDLLGFLDDNKDKLKQQFYTINETNAALTPVSKASSIATANVLSEKARYLPPMHAITLKLKTGAAAATSLTVTLDSTRVVTDTVHYAAAAAPMRRNGAPVLNRGIMTVTVINDVDERCTTQLLLGQGYNKEIRTGEDVLLTTINVDTYTVTSAPATPFNVYALEGDSALSINLLDSIVNVPISFLMTESLIPYFEPITKLWFTGVNNISEPLVLYDALTDTERPIIDGICIDIETPQVNNLARYYIRRRGYRPTSSDNPATGVGIIGADEEKAIKFIQNGIVYILRSGHVYTVLGQKIK